jgi:hypothetical protein
LIAVYQKINDFKKIRKTHFRNKILVCSIFL